MRKFLLYTLGLYVFLQALAYKLLEPVCLMFSGWPFVTFYFRAGCVTVYNGRSFMMGIAEILEFLASRQIIPAGLML